MQLKCFMYTSSIHTEATVYTTIHLSILDTTIINNSMFTTSCDTANIQGAFGNSAQTAQIIPSAQIGLTRSSIRSEWSLVRSEMTDQINPSIA